MKTKIFVSVLVALLTFSCSKKEDKLSGTQWGTTIIGGYNVLLSFTSDTRAVLSVVNPLEGINVSINIAYTYNSPALTVEIVDPEYADDYDPFRLEVHGSVINITTLVHELFPIPQVLALSEITLTKK